MDPIAKSVVPIRIEDELRSSYMDYSMSVIIGRALPDVRDGLKPVHRRILYAMQQEGLVAGRRYSKCAGVVGEVLKKYHPHGDSAVYDALVRMAQPWNLRYLLVDGQGNFGSVDGDPAAAYRYTECRMTRFAEEMLVDIEKETVSFSPNFDGTTEEPDVLPSRVPNLLVNGADGIAVGMATKIPPHNLGEVVSAAIALIQNPDLDLDELMEFVPGPDFPTAGTIYGRRGVREAYETGRGRVVVRGNASFEDVHGRRAIVIDELPYQVNKARLIEQIAELVRDKKLDGVHALRDESDRSGMRVVIELKKDAFEEVVLNHLYKHTALQSTFGVILLAIVNQRPRILSLKELLQHFIAHRREVILRRTRYDLKKARERAHILEGLRIALDHIDAVIATIRESRTVEEARGKLIERFALTEIQANAILEMRLQRLTGLERDKIEEEYKEVLARIAEYEEILGSETRLMEVVTEDLEDVREKYADARRTRILDARGELTMQDLVAEEDQIVTLSRLGYIKRCRPDEWRMQKRGGLGKKAMNTREEDFVTSMFVANTHANLLVFTTDGKVFDLPVFELPEAGRGARGRPIVNLLSLPDGAQIASIVPIRDRADGDDATRLLFVSRQGLVKATPLTAFRNLRTGGLIAAGVAEGDELFTVLIVESTDKHLMLFTRGGKCIRFELAQVPDFGRSARGNKGIELADDDVVVDAVLAPADQVPTGGDDEEEVAVEGELEGDPATEELYDTTLLTVTRDGYGKRTPFDKYRVQNRNGKGIQSIRIAGDTGVVGALEVRPDDQVMIVTDTGRMIRIHASEVRLVMGRATRGVRLMRLDDGETIVDFERLAEAEPTLDAEVDPEVDADVDVNGPDDAS
jgi:DNA gyrase subunit A